MVFLKQKPLWLVLGLGVILVIYLAYRYITSSPYYIKEKALQALLVGDYVALCKLADEDELTRLNITPENIAAILNEELGEEPLPPRIKDWLLPPAAPQTQLTWEVALKGDPVQKPHYNYVVIPLLYTPRGWRLLLTVTLSSVIVWHSVRKGIPYQRAVEKSYQLLSKHGVKGYRSEDGGFYIFGRKEKEW